MFRVFVVDDEEIIRTGIRNTLEKTGGRFLFTGEAPDGEMALPGAARTQAGHIGDRCAHAVYGRLELAALVQQIHAVGAHYFLRMADRI